MVDVAAAVEIDERLQGDLRGGGIGCRGKFFRGRVVGVDVGVVVPLMVQFHYFARDGGFEGAVVVCVLGV